MKRILHLKSSLQGANSYSLKLGNAIVAKIQEKYPDNILEELDLVEMEMPHLTPYVLQTFFTPTGQLTAQQQEAIKLSDTLTAQLLAADIIVIGAPLINLTIPSSLKAWIDHITRAGITFGYSETGPVGLVKGKKVYVAMSAGGVYNEGPGLAKDFVAPYLKAVLALLGMEDVTVFRADGLKVPGVKETAMQKALDSIVID